MHNFHMLQPVIHVTCAQNGKTGSDVTSDEKFSERLIDLVELFAADMRFAAATVVLPAGNDDAKRLVAVHESGPTVIVVPAGITDAMAAILSTSVKPAGQREGNLAVISANIQPDSVDDFVQLVHSAHVNVRTSGKAVLFVRRTRQCGQQTAFESGGTHRWTNLLTVRDAGLADETDQFAVAMEMGQLYEANGPVVVSRLALLEVAQQSMSAMVSSCSSAMAVAERKDGVFYPSAGFLTLVKGETLAQLLSDSYRSLLLHTGGEMMKVDTDAPTADVIPESVSIADQNAENSMVLSRDWGNERIIADNDEVRIIRLLIAAGKKAVRPAADDRTIHWAIAAGSAFAKTGVEFRTAVAGETLFVPSGHQHALTNIGQEPLIVYETHVPVKMPQTVQKQA